MASARGGHARIERAPPLRGRPIFYRGSESQVLLRRAATDPRKTQRELPAASAHRSWKLEPVAYANTHTAVGGPEQARADRALHRNLGRRCASLRGGSR